MGALPPFFLRERGASEQNKTPRPQAAKVASLNNKKAARPQAIKAASLDHQIRDLADYLQNIPGFISLAKFSRI